MPSKQKSPPPYYPDSRHHGSRDLYGERVSTRPSYSHYPNEDLPQFYKWTSPPGVIKIVSIIIVILCVAIFACVASTLAWDIDMELSGFGGMGSGLTGGSYGGGYGSMGGGYGSMGGGFGSMGGGGYGGSGGGYGYGGIGGNYADPKAGKGFIIAISALTFIAVLVIFILVVSRQNSSRSRKFYLAVIIISAILAIFMFISTIVYLVAINPTAQTSGSVFYNQIIALCSQYQNPQPSGIFINQYLYHYCVVEPQEAIAVVFGVLVTIGLIIIAVFAAKTRQQIQHYGEPNIVWEGVKVVGDGLSHDTGAWVNSTSGEPERMLNAYPDKFRGSRSLLEDSSTEYVKQLHSATKLPPATYSSDSEIPSSVWKPEKRVSKLLHPNSQDVGAESGEDLDDTDFDSEFPAITNEQKRQEYKKEFDRSHKEYKILQAELDDINKGLSEMDRELSRLPQGSSKYLDTMVEYNRLKNIKKSADYQMKKQRSRYLKAKLSHIKKMVNDHDRRR